MRQASRKPPIPPSAERAKTIACRGGRATVMLRAGGRDARRDNGCDRGCDKGWADGAGERVEPHMHHVHSDGAVTMLLADWHPLVAETARAERTERPTMIELADRAPVRLREPVRGLLWITGWLRVLDGVRARREVLSIAEENPDCRLLDAGHGMTVLRLNPASLVLADSEGSQSLRPAEFAAARPDPFCLYEDQWLRHLEIAHRDVVGLLTRLLPAKLRGGNVRPLGLDRFGLRLRVELPDADHDVRLPFTKPAATTEDVGVELRRMVGCPFLASQDGSAAGGVAGAR
ncbi:MAG TPA: DUF2470 domain-containing protein [Pseudonocardiaceae bacterium]